MRDLFGPPRAPEPEGSEPQPVPDVPDGVDVVEMTEAQFAEWIARVRASLPPSYRLVYRDIARATDGRTMIASIVPVPGYRLAFRDITNSTNQRTMIASIVPVGHGGGAAALVDFAPPGAGVSHHAAEMMPEPAVDEFLGAGKPGTMKKLVELASRACGELERRRREEQPE